MDAARKPRLRRPLGSLLAILLACALAGAPASASAPPLVLKKLSNLRSFSRWAYPTSSSVIRATPSAHGRPLGTCASSRSTTRPSCT